MAFPQTHSDGEVWNGTAVTDLENRAKVYIDAAVSGGGGGGGSFQGTKAVVAANTSPTLVIGYHNPVDASSGAGTVALPTPTAAGQWIGVEKEDSAANTVTISGSIRGSVTTNSLTAQFRLIAYISGDQGSGLSWWPVSDIKSVAYLNSLYAQLTGATFTGAVSTGGLTGATAASRYVGATTTGAPTSGTFLKGDFTIDQTGKIWVCITAGTPGTWAAPGGGGTSTLSGDTDVLLSSPADGQELVFVGSASKWENKTPVSSVQTGPGGTAGANTGSAQTIPSPLGSSGFGVYWGVMNAAAPAITLPSPVSGALFRLRLNQDGTGGRVPTFSTPSGTIVYPSGTWNFTGAAAAANFASFAVLYSDGTNWFVFPETSGFVFMSNPMTAVNDLIIGGSSGTPARLATVASKALVTDVSGNISWGTAGGGSTTLAGDTDVSITSPADGQNLRYSGVDSKWENQPEYKTASPNDFWLPSTGGQAKIATCGRGFVSANATPETTGKVYLVALPFPLRRGVTYTGIAFLSGSTAAGTPLNQWFTLVQASNLTLLRSTVDDTTTAWAANSIKALALSATYTPSSDTWVYLGLMVNATTVPSLLCEGGNSNANNIAPIYTGPISSGTGSTGQTTPLADATVLGVLGNGANIAFGYVY